MKEEALKNERPDRTEKKRVPLGQRNILSFEDQDKDYKYRIINDVGTRISKAEEGGYEFVDSDKEIGDKFVGKAKKFGKKVSMPVGNGVTGYLMRIKKDWYDTDQKEKMKVVDASEAPMKKTRKTAKEALQSGNTEYGEGLVTEKL
jgi:hypothetical protein